MKPRLPAGWQRTIDSKRRGGRFPLPHHEALLDITLGRSDPGMALWSWTTAFNQRPELALDEPERRLSHSLVDALHRSGVGVPDVFREQAMRAWSQMALTRRSLPKALRALADASVPVMGLKWLALAAHPSADVRAYAATRTSADIDLLVKPHDVERAVSALEAAGFVAHDAKARARLSALVPVWYETALNDSILTIDLHWSIVPGRQYEAMYQALWDGARETTFDGIPLLIPSPELFVAHVVDHGTAWGPEPTVRWITDVKAVCDADDLDPARFLETVRTLMIGPYVAEGLRYAANRFDVRVVDDAVLATAAALPVESRLESLDERRNAPLGVLRGLPLYRAAARALPPEAQRSTPAFLRALWGLDHFWQIPTEAVRRLGRS